MNYRKLFFILLAFASMQVSAQDLAHYKRVIKELASAKYQGRGYAKDGANKAGLFLEKEYRKAGVNGVTLQPFKLDINTFSGKMKVESLTPSPSPKGEGSSWKKLQPGENRISLPLGGDGEGSQKASPWCRFLHA